MTVVKKLVDRFLAWPLPKSVCSDTCATDKDYPHPRIGTNLLTADEARQMLEHVLEPLLAERKRYRQTLEAVAGKVDRGTQRFIIAALDEKEAL